MQKNYFTITKLCNVINKIVLSAMVMEIMIILAKLIIAKDSDLE